MSAACEYGELTFQAKLHATLSNGVEIKAEINQMGNFALEWAGPAKGVKENRVVMHRTGVERLVQALQAALDGSDRVKQINSEEL